MDTGPGSGSGMHLRRYDVLVYRERYVVLKAKVENRVE
jgi:hypothetical protein